MGNGIANKMIIKQQTRKNILYYRERECDRKIEREQLVRALAPDSQHRMRKVAARHNKRDIYTAHNKLHKTICHILKQ